MRGAETQEVHPEPLTSAGDFVARASVGPIHGGLVLAAGLLYCLVWGAAALWSWRDDMRRAGMRHDKTSMG